MGCRTPGFLSSTISQSLLRLISVKSVIPSNHLILCHLPSPFAFNPSQYRSFLVSWLFASGGQSFGFRISPPSEYSGLISFRIDWFALLAVQGTLKSLPQHHSLKASVLWLFAFFMVQLSHLYFTTRKTIALTICTFIGKVMSLLLICWLGLL